VNLSSLLENRDLLICVGSGGVGKTTTAAALALRAAQDGRKVLVLTIDPAKRLANSLGMKRFGNEETRIQLEDAKGELWAMMLDNRRTFDDLIDRVSPNETTRDRVLGNRIYRIISGSISGSQDYMATEKLHDVALSKRYDLVVLDTPPVKNALDFLEAPGRLARFLDRRIMKWFLTPYDEKRVFGRLLMGTSAVVFRLLAYIFGRDFLADLSEFFMAFRDLYDGFRQRHEAVLQLFQDGRTAFVVVCAPTEPSVKVATYFLDELRTRKMPNPGVIVNQCHMVGEETSEGRAVLETEAKSMAEDLGTNTVDRLLARLGAAHHRLIELSRTEMVFVDQIKAKIRPDQEVWPVPRLEHEVNDVASLKTLGQHLFHKSM